MFHNTHNVSCNKWNNLPFHSFLGPFILVCSFIKEFIVLCNMCDETFKVLNAKLFPMDQFIHKVYTFWEGHTIMRNLHLTFALCSASQKYWWRFRKILWPSQNIWTLTVLTFTQSRKLRTLCFVVREEGTIYVHKY